MKNALNIYNNLELENFINGSYFYEILNKINPSNRILPYNKESNDKIDSYLINLDFILRFIREIYQVTEFKLF